MKREQQLVQTAQTQGLLPPAANEALHDPSPSWVVTLVSLIGAQFAVWPFLIVIAFMGGESLIKAPQSFFVAAILIGVAIIGLRGKQPLFVSHLSFTAMLTGFAVLFISMTFYLKAGYSVFVVLLLAQLGAAWCVRVDWVQRILGMGATLAFLMIVPQLLFGTEDANMRVTWWFPQTNNALVLAMGWAAWCAYEVRFSGRKVALQLAAFVEGVGVALLCLQIYTSGALFTMGSNRFGGMQSRQGSADSATAGLSNLFEFNGYVVLHIFLVAGSWWWLTRRWALGSVDKRREWALITVVYLGLAVSSFFRHDGGVVVLVGTAALATGRSRMVALALVVLLAQLSGFYYALQWPLVDKATLLVAAGVFLGLFLWVVRKQFNAPVIANVANQTKSQRSVWTIGLIAAGAALALGAANYDVAKKERVISGGQKIYISLAPRDPRSIMQGDYMALNFGFPREIENQLDALNTDRSTKQANVVAKLDARGVAQVLRLAADNETLASGEILLPLMHKNQRWVLVTDAFFFPEGQGVPFKQARFGEFRVLSDGRALLVGLADESLVTIRPKKMDDPEQ